VPILLLVDVYDLLQTERKNSVHLPCPLRGEFLMTELVRWLADF